MYQQQRVTSSPRVQDGGQHGYSFRKKIVFPISRRQKVLIDSHFKFVFSYVKSFLLILPFLSFIFPSRKQLVWNFGSNYTTGEFSKFCK